MNEKYKKKLERFLLQQQEKKMKKKIRKAKQKKKTKAKDKVIKSIDKVVVKKKKRRVGRPRKPGPKKKRIRRKIVKIIKPHPLINFKIITTLNGKQTGYIGCYYTYEEAYAQAQNLIEKNKKIIFPRKFLNSEDICTSKDEYLILEKNRLGDKTDGVARNEYGKLITQKIINNDGWVIREKFPRIVEETFWVYGYDPKTDRKTFQWIYDNLLLGALEHSYDIIRVLLYKNKLIIKYDNKPMTIVMCKNVSDSIRMYNLIDTKKSADRCRQITCVGAYNTISDKRRELEKDIMDLTGWTKLKIQRSHN